MKDFLEKLLKNIVTKPDEVTVAEEVQEDWYRFSVKVASEDMGLVIGKSGKNISAIRTVLRIKAIQENKQVYVELIEPDKAQE